MIEIYNFFVLLNTLTGYVKLLFPLTIGLFVKIQDLGFIIRQVVVSIGHTKIK